MENQKMTDLELAIKIRDLAREASEEDRMRRVQAELNLNAEFVKTAFWRTKYQDLVIGLTRRMRCWVLHNLSDEAYSPSERMARLLEETFELAQAQGIKQEIAESILKQVYAKNPGYVPQESGSVFLCLLGFCDSVKVDVFLEANKEMQRIENVPRDVVRKRWLDRVRILG